MKFKNGFTMMELLVVFILVAILAQVAIVAYRRAMEDAALDKARTTLEEVSAAIGRMQMDYPLASITPGGTDNNLCIIKKTGGAYHFNQLIKCGYLKDRNWTDDYDYTFYGCSGQTTSGCCAIRASSACMIGTSGRYSGHKFNYTFDAGVVETSN